MVLVGRKSIYISSFILHRGHLNQFHQPLCLQLVQPHLSIAMLTCALFSKKPNLVQHNQIFHVSKKFYDF